MLCIIVLSIKNKDDMATILAYYEECRRISRNDVRYSVLGISECSRQLEIEMGDTECEILFSGTPPHLRGEVSNGYCCLSLRNSGNCKIVSNSKTKAGNRNLPQPQVSATPGSEYH